MCHLSIAVDRSIDTVAPLFAAIDSSAFYIRSIRIVPVAWSSEADVHLSLGGGSNRDLDMLLAHLHELPAVLSTHHVMPPAWTE